MKYRVLCVILSLALFSCSVTRPARGEQNDDVPAIYDSDSLRTIYLYTEGLKKAMINNDFGSAKRYFERAIENDSLHAPSYYELANLCTDTLAEQGMEYIAKAVRIDSTNVDYNSLMGRFLIVTGRYTEARRLYDRLVGEDPNNPNNYRMLAALYEYDHQPFTAIAVLDSAEYKLGRIEELADYKRQLLINVKMYDRAIEETKALIDDSPYMDDNYVILAELYGYINKDSLAIANYNQALRIDSTKMETLFSLAEYHKKRNRNLEYLSTIRKIFSADNIPLDTKKNMFEDLTANIDYYRDNYFTINSLATRMMVQYPNDFSVTRLYATHLIRSGEIEQASALYKTYSESHSAEEEAYYAILDIEAYLQRPDSVAKYSALALESFPKNSDIYVRQGYALANMKQNDSALKSYRLALKYAQTDSLKSAVLGTIGDLHYQMEKREKGYATYRKSLSYNGNNAMVLNNYAYFLSEDGKQLEKAYEMSKKACELSQNNSTYLDTQAWILYCLGRYDEAKKIMQQALALDSSGSDVLLVHYGDILYELGDYFMARTYWRRALEKGFDSKAIEERLEKVKNK